jgi:L-iditol 2-dehydrogenase
MTAAVLYGKEDVRIEQVPIPKAAAGELILRVGAALTCGTDLKVYRRGYHAKMIIPPALFGHEVAGSVVELGAGVTQFAIGDRVVALNSAPCGECYYCKRAQENLCDHLLFNNGAYAKFIRIPAAIVAKNTLKLPANLPFEHAALTEPLACALHALIDSAPRPGDTFAVIGAGPLGLLLIHAASLKGFRVIAVVKRDAQVKLATHFGAQQVIQFDKVSDPVAAVRALTDDQRGVDIAIEAVATPLTWQWAVGMVRKGGTVNFFGGPPAGTVVELDTNRLHYSDITLRATFHHTPSICRKALELISDERFLAADFITSRAKLVELDGVLRKLMLHNTGIKTVILP